MPDIYHPGRVPDWFYGGAPSSRPDLGAALAPHAPSFTNPANQPQSASAGGAAGAAPALPDFSEISNLIGQINATNQAAQQAANAGRIPGASQLEQLSSNSIAGLLNPPEQIGEIDTGAAARALGSGTSGSPFAGHMGILLNENERIRRQGIGQQFLTSALGRNPSAPIADSQQLLQFIQQQRFQADQAARNRDFEGQQAALNRALQAQIAFLNQNRRDYGPHLPTSYGRGGGGASTFSANIPSGVDPYYNPDNYSGAYELPDFTYTSGGGEFPDVNPAVPQSPDLYDLPDFSMEDYSAYA